MVDRSDLSKLYPEVKSENINQTKPVEDIPAQNYAPKFGFIHSLSIAILLSMSIVMFVQFSNFLNQNVDVNNIVNQLSGILLILALWIFSLIFVIFFTFTRLNDSGISKFSFLLMYAICALPISQLIYKSYRHYNHGVVSIVPYAGMLLIENIIFVFFLLTVMNSHKMSQKIKNILLVSSIIICVLTTLIGNMYIK
jgi:hypothetical protein